MIDMLDTGCTAPYAHYKVWRLKDPEGSPWTCCICHPVPLDDEDNPLLDVEEAEADVVHARS